MTLATKTIFELRTGGSDTNGGGFVEGASGTDWTQQDAAQYAVTDAVTNGTTTITSATANFGTDVVGNVLYIQGGTGSITAGWYEITARSSTTTITVDRSTGLTTGTGATLNIGGALASVGGLGQVWSNASQVASGQRAYIKAGTYSVASTTPNVSGGRFSVLNYQVTIEGYETTRGDLGTKPVIVANVSGVTLLSIGSGRQQKFINLELDGNSGTGAVGINNTSCAYFCKGYEFSSYAFSNMDTCYFCEAYDCLAGYNNTSAVQSVAYGCSQAGFSGRGYFTDCLSYDNSGSGFIALNADGAVFLRCVAEGNAQRGFYSNVYAHVAVNCVAVNNTGIGYEFNGFASHSASALIGCADYNNSSRKGSGVGIDIDPIALSADPFEDSANNDYRLNTDSGGGALLSAIGYGAPAQTDYRDINAVQTEASGGGGGSGGFFIQ